MIVACVALLLACERDEKAADIEPHADAGGHSSRIPRATEPMNTHAVPDAAAAQEDPLPDAASDASAPGACGGALRLRCGDRISDSTPGQGDNRLSLYACTARAE